MRIPRTVTVSATCALGLAMVFGTTSASADPGAAPGDVVGVGSDTVQNVMDFVADGSPALGSPYTTAAGGFNSAGGKNRVFNYSATADQNDRAVYGPGSAVGAASLATTVILRAGTNPVRRPNGSGQGLDALSLQTAAGTGFPINYARSSSLGAFTSTTSNRAAISNTNGTGGIHAVRIATDDLVLATANTTNAVTVTGDQLLDIYNCVTTNWSILGGTAGTIKPLIPQSGSGTRNTFIADLTTIQGSTFDPTGKTCLTTVEENDPAGITTLSATDAPNAIDPFSSGRLDLFNLGYFKTPGFPAGGTVNPGIKLLYGTQTPDACSAVALHQTTQFCDTRGLYIGWLAQDDTSSTSLLIGGSKNYVQTLFANTNGSTGTPYVNSNPGKALISRGGVTPAYSDCGISTGGSFGNSGNPGCS